MARKTRTGRAIIPCGLITQFPSQGKELVAYRGPEDSGTMTVGIPRGIKEQEFRVALLPAAVNQLVKRGHQVIVESGAGAGIGFHDNDYQLAGAEVVPSHEEVFATADLVVKVKEPLASECALLRNNQILFAY